MPRTEARRPPPIDIPHKQHDHEELPRERFEDLIGRSQITGNLNPDELETLAELGGGNGGFVTKVKHRPSNQILATKTIRLEVNTAERNRILKELEVLNECKSPYIVGYFGLCHRNGEINIFMEYMDGRSLDFILTKTARISEDILGKITISVVKGLTYLRDKLNIMHRDIKPSNILVNSHGHIKICDFGVSGQLINSIAQSFVGTRQYMSPERLFGHSYSVQSDIWSLGLSLVELALGMYPIPQHDPMLMYKGERPPEAGKMPVFELMQCIANEPPPTIPGPPIFTEEFKEFVDRCLEKSLEARFDLHSIVKHAFFIKSDNTHVGVDLWVCQVCSGSVAGSQPPESQNSPQVKVE